MPKPVLPPPLLSELAGPAAPSRLRGAVCWGIAILWAVLALARFVLAGPEDSAAACRHRIYRDPVTGREQGIGEARIARDGTAICGGAADLAARR